MSGLFITLEGIDGSGKTTLRRNLVKQLEEMYPGRIVETFEPGGTKLGNNIRSLLLREDPPCFLSVLYLFRAAREQHLEEVITPALKDNKIVICDRYIDSTEAYQIAMLRTGNHNNQRGSEANIYDSLRGLPLPDLTLLILIPADEALKRIDDQKTSVGIYTKEFLDTVCKQYSQIYIHASDRIEPLNGFESPEQVCEDALHWIKIEISKRGWH